MRCEWGRLTSSFVSARTEGAKHTRRVTRAATRSKGRRSGEDEVDDLMLAVWCVRGREGLSERGEGEKETAQLDAPRLADDVAATITL